jgi:nicotinamidase-related amidase
MMRKVIVVIDMQNDFIDGALGTKEAQAMLPCLVKKLEQEKDALLIFTQDTHGSDYMETQEGKIFLCRTASSRKKAGRLRRLCSRLSGKPRPLWRSRHLVLWNCRRPWRSFIRMKWSLSAFARISALSPMR